ncbi:MAG: helix-turn-helix transcriptional regulator [Thermoanaerobaculia bacterium]
MDTIERDIERVLTLLRNKIRERSLTQLQVQDALGWGRSYISQLLTKQKSLRVEQVLKILQVIKVSPTEFFGELFYHQQPFPPAAAAAAKEVGSGAAGPSSIGGTIDPGGSDLGSSYRELSTLLRGLLRVLVERKIIKPEDLNSAVQASDGVPEALLQQSSE